MNLNFTNVVTSAILLATVSLLTLSVNAQPSSERKNPTLLDPSGEYSNYMVTTDRPISTAYYITFLAGPGDITIDTTISSRHTRAQFDWALFDHPTVTVKNGKKHGCYGRLNHGVTHKSVTCSFGSHATLHQVVLVFDNYIKGEPFLINYKIHITGDWKPLNMRGTIGQRTR